MATRQTPPADKTVFDTESTHPIDDLPKLTEAIAVCLNCGSTEVVSQPAHDLKPGRKAVCEDCNHGGRVKTNRYGRVEWIQGFRLAGYEGEQA